SRSRRHRILRRTMGRAPAPVPIKCLIGKLEPSRRCTTGCCVTDNAVVSQLICDVSFERRVLWEWSRTVCRPLSDEVLPFAIPASDRKSVDVDIIKLDDSLQHLEHKFLFLRFKKVEFEV